MLFSVHWPKHINFSDPESEGLSGTINFYLETSPNVQGMYDYNNFCKLNETTIQPVVSGC